jgi:hypothetical protein
MVICRDILTRRLAKVSFEAPSTENEDPEASTEDIVKRGETSVGENETHTPAIIVVGLSKNVVSLRIELRLWDSKSQVLPITP